MAGRRGEQNNARLLKKAKRQIQADSRLSAAQKQIAAEVIAELERRAQTELRIEIKAERQKAEILRMAPELAALASSQAQGASNDVCPRGDAKQSFAAVSAICPRNALGQFTPNPRSIAGRKRAMIEQLKKDCARNTAAIDKILREKQAAAAQDFAAGNAAVKCLETLLLSGMGQQMALDDHLHQESMALDGHLQLKKRALNEACLRESKTDKMMAESFDMRKGQKTQSCDATPEFVLVTNSQAQGASGYARPRGDAKQSFAVVSAKTSQSCDAAPEFVSVTNSQAQGASGSACPRGGAGQSPAAVSANQSFGERAKRCSKAKILLPPKLVPVFTGSARYRCAYGGRGSGKTRSFAKMAAIRGYQLACAGKSGLIVTGREFMNALSESSLAEVKAAIASEPFLAEFYDVGADYVRTKDRRISFAFIGLRHNLDSLKSKARIHLLWADEAESISETAWQKIIPTVREPDSEIWVTWNPESRASATHKRFRLNPPADAKIAQMNWRDNPWFPQVLERERRADKALRPEHYPHIWEGDFVSFIDGAYYAKALQAARDEGRIGRLECDPLMEFRAFWDIGGTGARSDATSIWIAQFIGDEIHVLDYYEAQGQPLARHIDWLRTHGYGAAQMILPHDGSARDRVHDVSFEAALYAAGFAVEVIGNQGAGAARLRVEAARRLFGQMRFDEARCQGGLLALNAYREKRDASRNIGLGPEHDWASHAADAFGLMCIAYEKPDAAPPQMQGRMPGSRYGASHAQNSWMAG